MQRAINIILFRTIELLLGVPLWEAYKSAHHISDYFHLFMNQSELAQVGTITIIAIIVNALYRIVVDVYEVTYQRSARSHKKHLESHD